jgi:hypothetical protein
MTRKVECGTRKTNERSNKSFVHSAVFICFVFSLWFAGKLSASAVIERADMLVKDD